MPEPLLQDKPLSLAEIVLIIAIFVILLAVAIPNYLEIRKKTKINQCRQNITSISQIKGDWAVENPGKDNPTSVVLVKFLTTEKWPICPAGGKYEIGDLKTAPTCSIHFPKRRMPNNERWKNY